MRKLVKAAAALTAGCMLLSTSAFAAVSDNINETAQLTGGAYQVDLTYDTKSGQSTILVVKEGTALADVNDQNILYINQDAINTETGVVSYNVNLGAAFTGNADVWVGGTNETATKIGTLSGIKEVVGLTLAADKTTLEIGETATITPTFDPADATDKTLTWTSSSDAIATVANGVVTAVSAGTATITATTVNNKTATIDITVNAAAPAPDYITSADTDKATITVARYTFAKGSAPYSKATIALNTEKYPNAGNESAAYILKMVDANGVGIDDAEVFYSPERKLYVAVFASSVTDYKFEVVTDDVANDTFIYGNVNLDANNVINNTDKMQIVNYIKDNSKIITTLKKSAAADVNGDGRVNNTDKMQIVNLIKARTTDPDAKLNIVK